MHGPARAHGPALRESAQLNSSAKSRPFAITFIVRPMMRALKKNASVVCHTIVHRIRESTNFTSETAKVVAFVKAR